MLSQFWEDFKTFPAEAQLFCPRTFDHDLTNYRDLEAYDEDGVSAEEKKKRVADSDHRHVTTYRLSLLLAWDAEGTSTWPGEWSDRVNTFLSKCDSCAKNWHKSRDSFLKALEVYVCGRKALDRC